jgi:hypothetical protein
MPSYSGFMDSMAILPMDSCAPTERMGMGVVILVKIERVVWALEYRCWTKNNSWERCEDHSLGQLGNAELFLYSIAAKSRARSLSRRGVVGLPGCLCPGYPAPPALGLC